MLGDIMLNLGLYGLYYHKAPASQHQMDKLKSDEDRLKNASDEAE